MKTLEELDSIGSEAAQIENEHNPATEYERRMAYLEAIRDHILANDEQVVKMKEALLLAPDTFRRYADLHYAKNTLEGNVKGDANLLRAQEINSALAHPKP